MTLGGRKTTGRPTAGASRPKKRGNILAARVGHLGLGRGQERLLKSPSLARLDTEAAGDQEEEVVEEAADREETKERVARSEMRRHSLHQGSGGAASTNLGDPALASARPSVPSVQESNRRRKWRGQQRLAQRRAPNR